MLLTGEQSKAFFSFYSLSSSSNHLFRKLNALLYLDRVVLAVGFFLFSCAVLYVVSKRIGLLKLQRSVTAALKAGMAGQGEIRPRAVEDPVNLARVYDNAVPNVEMPLERAMHDEL